MKFIDLYKLLFELSYFSENILITVRSCILMEYRCGGVRTIADYSAITEGCLLEYQQCDFNIAVPIDDLILKS